MTKIFLAIVIGFAIIVWLFFRPEPLAYTNYPLKEGPVIAFGDSLVYGTGSTNGNDFVSLLSKKWGESVINLGVPGDTTTDGLGRLEDVVAHKPRLVIVLLGGNDYLRRMPIEETFSNLDTIITRIEESGAMVVLLGIQGGVLGDPFEPEFRALSKKHDLLYIPSILNGIIGDGALMADTIHPNDAGHALIAERIAEEMIAIVPSVP